MEAVALSSVQPLSATGSIDGTLMIWDNASLSVRGTCPHPEVGPGCCAPSTAAGHLLPLGMGCQIEISEILVV